MSIIYVFENMADLAQHFSTKAEELRDQAEKAPKAANKSNLISQAHCFEQVAHTISNTQFTTPPKPFPKPFRKDPN